MHQKLRSIARRSLPAPLRRALKRLRGVFAPYSCPVCGESFYEWQTFYRDVGEKQPRPERACMCPFCYSMERTRHIWLYIEQNDLLHDRPRFLHVAPETGLERRFRATLGNRYVTTDLVREDVDCRTDLTATGFNDGAYDLIYCSNVLEHVENDRAAMAELYRILAPGGLAIIQVPIQGKTTLEDPSVVTPTERARLFGQADHVRYYGSDIADRLHAAGFTVEETVMPDCLKPTAAMLKRYNIAKSEPVHFCRKARANA
jgi:Methyltransferase domain